MKKIPYRQALSKLLYLALGTRPDIAFAVSALSRFANNPGQTYWTLMKCVIQYIKVTYNYGLLYTPTKEPTGLHAMSDASYRSMDVGRSYYGYAVFLNESCWIWKSHISKNILTSPQQAELFATHHCLKDVTYATHLLSHLQMPIPKPTLIQSDSATNITVVI